MGAGVPVNLNKLQRNIDQLANSNKVYPFGFIKNEKYDCAGKIKIVDLHVCAYVTIIHCAADFEKI